MINFSVPKVTIPIFVRRCSAVHSASAVGNQPPISSVASPSDLVASHNANTSTTTWSKSTYEFPVRRIYCVGRNYRQHAIEMGGDPDREPPFFFQKPSDSIVFCPALESSAKINTVTYPPMTSSLHYEGELVVAIGQDGLRISADNASDHIYGYAVGCDLTRRDLQSEAKKHGKPWDASKGFDGSCPIGPIVPKDECLDGKSKFFAGLPSKEAELSLYLNGELRQQSLIQQMIYSIPEIISHISESFRLRAGDLILTGTPAGVSSLKIGDCVDIFCCDLPPCQFVVGPRD